jgi:hypothetical protein
VQRVHYAGMPIQPWLSVAWQAVTEPQKSLAYHVALGHLFGPPICDFPATSIFHQFPHGCLQRRSLFLRTNAPDVGYWTLAEKGVQSYPPIRAVNYQHTSSLFVPLQQLLPSQKTLSHVPVPSKREFHKSEGAHVNGEPWVRRRCTKSEAILDDPLQSSRQWKMNQHLRLRKKKTPE